MTGVHREVATISALKQCGKWLQLQRLRFFCPSQQTIDLSWPNVRLSVRGGFWPDSMTMWTDKTVAFTLLFKQTTLFWPSHSFPTPFCGMMKCLWTIPWADWSLRSPCCVCCCCCCEWVVEEILVLSSQCFFFFFFFHSMSGRVRRLIDSHCLNLLIAIGSFCLCF